MNPPVGITWDFDMKIASSIVLFDTDSSFERKNIQQDMVLKTFRDGQQFMKSYLKIFSSYWDY